jgi:hypothetical protein
MKKAGDDDAIPEEDGMGHLFLGGICSSRVNE